jgi:hypothetical protein
MARDKQAKTIHQMTVAQWERAFPTEDACRAYLVNRRWPAGVACPRCGAVNVKAHGTMPWNWLCNMCSPSKTNYRFSHITGTFFEDTKKPLRQWFRVIHMMLTSKSAVSSLQVHRVLGFGGYRTALNMCERVRAGLADEEFQKLIGVVEVGGTFVVGKAKNWHIERRGDAHARRQHQVGADERAAPGTAE